MCIKVNSNELLKRLEQLVRVVENKSSIPILSDVLIKTKGNVMLLTTSDSESWLSLKCPLIEDCDSTEFCVNAKDFYGLVKNIDGEICISSNEDACTITCDYGNGNFSMPYDNADEFPDSNEKTGEMSVVILEGKMILEAIEKAGYAVGNDIIRPIINGIHFNFDENGMCASATDKFKVVIFREKQPRISSGNIKCFTMPKKPCSILSSILSSVDGEVKLMFDTSYFSVNNQNFKMTTRLIEGRYPNCEGVIPKTCAFSVTADRGSLIQAIRRVVQITDKTSNIITMLFGRGQVVVAGDNAILSKSASETVACSCDSEMAIGFNGSYLLETLRNIDDDNVVIELSDPMSCAVFYAASSYSKDEYISALSPLSTK